jgi:hypothetical protein
LATAWKNSALFRKLHTNDPEGGAAIKDLEKNDGIDAAAQQVQQWWPEHKRDMLAAMSMPSTTASIDR